MARKIQFRRGKEANLPILDVAEFGFTTDSKRTFIGSGTENIEFIKREEINTIKSETAKASTEHINAEFVKESKKINDDVTKFKTEINTDFGDFNKSVAVQLAEKAQRAEVFLKSQGININDWDEPTRKAFLEAQGIDVNYVLGYKNVKPENASFFTVGKNKFNKATRILDKTLNTSNGSLADSDSNDTSDYIPVLPRQAGIRKVNQRIAFYDENKNFISGAITTSDKTFTVPENAFFMRVTVPKSFVDVFQVEWGSVETPYEAYSESVGREYLGNVLTTEDAPSFASSEKIESIIEPTRNLLNQEDDNFQTGYVLSSSGNPYPVEGYHLSGFIPANAGDNVLYSIDGVRQNWNSIASYDENGLPIEGSRSGAGNSYVVAEGATSFRVASQYIANEKAQIEIGENVTLFVKFGSNVKGENLKEIEEKLAGIEGSAIDLIRAESLKPFTPAFRNARMKFDVNTANQGVAVYDNHIYTCNSANIYKYDMDGNELGSVYVKADEFYGEDFCVVNNIAYVPLTNYTNIPREGKIQKVDVTTMEIIETVDLSESVHTASLAYKNGLFWMTVTESDLIYVYDESFNLQKTYQFPVLGRQGSAGEVGAGYSGFEWIGNFVFGNKHGGSTRQLDVALYVPLADKFVAVAALNYVSSGTNQGLAYDEVNKKVYWAARGHSDQVWETDVIDGMFPLT